MLAFPMTVSAMGEKESGAPVRCHSCLKEIDFDQSQAMGVVNYLLHFCGTECYAMGVTVGDQGELTESG